MPFVDYLARTGIEQKLDGGGFATVGSVKLRKLNF